MTSLAFGGHGSGAGLPSGRDELAAEVRAGGIVELTSLASIFGAARTCDTGLLNEADRAAVQAARLAVKQYLARIFGAASGGGAPVLLCPGEAATHLLAFNWQDGRLSGIEACEDKAAAAILCAALHERYRHKASSILRSFAQRVDEAPA